MEEKNGHSDEEWTILEEILSRMENKPSRLLSSVMEILHKEILPLLDYIDYKKLKSDVVEDHQNTYIKLVKKRIKIKTNAYKITMKYMQMMMSYIDVYAQLRHK